MTEILTAKDGHFTAKKDGTYLLSAYQPKRDVERVFNEDTEGKFIVVFGSALGYVDQLLKQRGVLPHRYRIIEPDGVIASHTEQPVLHPDRLNGLMNWMESRLCSGEKPVWIAMPAYVQLFSQSYQQSLNAYTENLRHAVENMKVTAYFSKLWHINFFRNLHSVVQAGKVLRLENPESRPALIVAAGPGLDGYLDDIKRYASRFQIISVLSAARTLNEAGILPDAIVISDAGIGNKLHYSGVNGTVPILASVYSNSALLSSVPNPVVFYDLDSEIDQPAFQVKYPSVTIDAGLIPRTWGEPVIFVGFDLSYDGAGATHTLHNAFMRRNVHRANRLHPITTSLTDYLKRKDLQYENGHYTNPQFRMVRDVSDELFPGATVLGDGLSFRNLRRVDRISETDIPGNDKIPFRVIDDPQSGKMIRHLSETLRHKFDSLFGNDEASEFFLRERLSGEDFGSLIDYYRKKLEFFCD